jgi:hypothetical protein
MEALGLLAGGVAHDLNNIIVSVTTLPELLLLETPQESPIRSQPEEIRILEIKPGTKAIIVGGYAEINAMKKAQELAAGVFLQKPYSMQDLAVAVRDGLQKIR